jgi:hypothetical protein
MAGELAATPLANDGINRGFNTTIRSAAALW